jgi:flagellar biosynthetic protein FliR
MNFEFSIAVSAIKFLAVLSRISALVFALPVFNSTLISTKYKMFMVLILSLVLLPILPEQWGDKVFIENMDIYALTFILLSEALMGLCASLIVQIFIEMFSFGGFLIDQNMGFIMAKVIDPSSRVQNTIFSNLLSQILVLMFIITNSHLEVIRLLADSFRTVGPGAFVISNDIANPIITLSSQIFVVGLQLAFPIVAIIILMNIGMGLMARVGQDFPVLMLSFPLRFGLGFIIVLAIMPVIITISRQSCEHLVQWLGFLVQVEA